MKKVFLQGGGGKSGSSCIWRRLPYRLPTWSGGSLQGHIILVNVRIKKQKTFSFRSLPDDSVFLSFRRFFAAFPSLLRITSVSPPFQVRFTSVLKLNKYLLNICQETEINASWSEDEAEWNALLLKDVNRQAVCFVFQNADRLSLDAFASVNRTGRLSGNFLPPVIVDSIEA